MKMSIEKTDLKGNKTIIESDTYDVELIDKPSQEQVQSLLSLLSNEPVNFISNDGKIGATETNVQMSAKSWLPSVIIQNIGTCLNRGGMYFVNSSDDILNGAIPPFNPSHKARGVVGYAGLDWTTYSGNSTVYGTMNLSESKRSVGLKKQTHHVVVDFPTHACNGSFDTIYITESAYRNNSVGHASYAPFQTQQFTPVVTEVIGTPFTWLMVRPYLSLSAPSYVVPMQDGTIFVTDLQSKPTGKVGVYRNGKTATIDISQSGNYYRRAGSFFERDGKYYMSWVDTNGTTISNNRLFELIVNETDDAITLEANSVGNLSLFFTNDHFPSSKGKYIRHIGKWKNFNYSIYTDDYYSIDESQKLYVAFYDKDWNIIKVHSFSSGIHNSISTFNDDDGNSYLIVDGNIFNESCEYVGTSSLHHNDSKGGLLMTDGIINYYWSSVDGPAPYVATGSGSAYRFLLCKCTNKKQAPIKIKLKEPLNKTNVETLKLIFDFEIELN